MKKQPVSPEAALRELQFLDVKEGPKNLELFNEIYLPVHEYVYLTDQEVHILNHMAVQRLRFICQLGLAYLVFPGATHTRFEHSLGTVQTAQMIISAVEYNRKRMLRNGTDPSKVPKPFSIEERLLIRLSALLHDIGHLAMGHTIEDELKLLSRHDEHARIKLVMDKFQWRGQKVESLRVLINTEYESLLHRINAKPADLVAAIIEKKSEIKIEESEYLRLSVCRDIVGNTICADFLDYIHRDLHHLGKPKQLERRIFQYMELRFDPDTNNDQMVVSLGDKDRLRTDAITAIAGLLDNRYELTEVVIFHRAKCKAAAMLERALLELQDSRNTGATTEEKSDKLKSWKLDMEGSLLRGGAESGASGSRFLVSSERSPLGWLLL